MHMVRMLRYSNESLGSIPGKRAYSTAGHAVHGAGNLHWDSTDKLQV